MAYITIDEAKQYLGDKYESAYLNINTGLADEAILQADIDDITSKINGYVKQVYNKTITGTEALGILRGVSRRLLDYEAYSRFQESEIPPDVIDRNKDAMIRLKDIQSGKIRFTDEVQDGRDSVVTSGYGQTDSGYGRNRTVFTRGKMTGI